MPGEIVFHIGDRKTGSSSIQAALLAGAARAEGVTLAYPSRSQHRAQAKSLLRAGDAGRRQASWRALADQIAGTEADVTVVSAESFEDVAPEVLGRAIETFLPAHAGRIRLVAYVRPHAERVLSSYAQMVKLGHFTGTLEEFHTFALADGRYLYAPRFGAWRAFFGPAFTLRPMVRDCLAGGDVVRDFFTVLFGDRPFTLDPLPRRNESPDLAQLAMLRHFHRTAPTDLGRDDIVARQRAGWHFARRLAAVTPAGGERLQMHHALATRVQADYAEDAAALDAAFFPGDTPLTRTLAAAAGRAIAAPQSLEIADHFDATGCRQIDFWCSMVTHLLRRDPAEWSHYVGTLDPAAGDDADGGAPGNGAPGNPGRPRQAAPQGAEATG